TVIVECGFLSNKRELELLKQKEYQQKMAFCVFCGITDYFNNQ
ncbi:MAG: N-acetylmuramoyl-L-alanine amidase, partial [Clostridia bacterium]|nr:N-acetylmuramoyl-L-alanine amidase [Clostridia bacterium]